MRLTGFILAGAFLLPVVAVRLVFLAPGRLGWIMYLANVFSEFFVKRVGWPRGVVELGIGLAGLGMLRLAGVPWVWVLASALGLAGLELYVRWFERRLLVTSYTPLDRIGLGPGAAKAAKGLAQGYPAPSTHPELTINLAGPLIERVPEYRLGTLVVGREFELCLIIGNHTLVPTQTGIRVRVTAPTSLLCTQDFAEIVPRLGSGGVHLLTQRWMVQHAGGGGSIHFQIEWGERSQTIEVRFDRCVAAQGLSVAEAEIRRYPGGCRSAFAWRGDMDLYDESTLQSIEGLEATFGLAARYRLPQTMYLSTRLSLDLEAAQQYANHYGCDRGAARIPEFIEWMRARVELRHVCGYPYRSAKPYVIELGNHGHLHFGTTAAAPENGWNDTARMGAGVYPWLGEDRSSMAEQRDNALEARRFCERLFGYTPKSWAMPDRTNDRHTAAAMEAAGCEVLSDSNVSALQNVLLQPAPHHPHDTSAVELTKRYPGDPQHIYHVAMNLFWIHRAYRRAIPVIFMCHQHLRLFDGHACTRFTEYVLRYALERFRGDFYINTVYGIGKYWREVLSPRTARVKVQVEGERIHVVNGSDFDLSEAPVDVALDDGARLTLLVSVPAGATREFALNGKSG